MKKPQIKINFLYYETPFYLKTNFFYKLLRRKYHIIISDKPDYVFFSVYKGNNRFLNKDGTVPPSRELKSGKNNLLIKLKRKLLKKEKIMEIIWFLKEKRFLKPHGKIMDIKGDFVKIFYTFENIIPDMTKCDWAFGFEYEEKMNNPKYFRLPYYFVATGSKGLIKDFKKMNFKKSKFCNFIYNNPVPLRNKFFKKLSKYKRIDAPGECMQNTEYLDNRDKKNWLELRRAYLKDYKFTIAFENSSSRGYTTDKLTEPMRVGSIPIYWGNPLVGREFNKKSFLDLRDFNSMDELIRRIIEINTNDKEYHKILKEPWLKKNKINKWMDEERVCKRLIKIIELK